MRPLIGITANYDLEQKLFTVNEAYISSIISAGAVPLLLTPSSDELVIAEYFLICNGFLFSGGGDIDPNYWNEIPVRDLGNIVPLRDYFELNLAKKAFLAGKPCMGICRGCQVLNVAAGGTVVQHLTTSMCHMQKAPRNYPFHDIFIKEGLYLERIMQRKEIRVNSFHHQAVEKTGKNLTVSACATDGIIEAIESIEEKFYLGVQWHPESMNDEFSARLFQAFVNSSEDGYKRR